VDDLKADTPSDSPLTPTLSPEGRGSFFTPPLWGEEI